MVSSPKGQSLDKETSLFEMASLFDTLAVTLFVHVRRLTLASLGGNLACLVQTEAVFMVFDG